MLRVLAVAQRDVPGVSLTLDDLAAHANLVEDAVRVLELDRLWRAPGTLSGSTLSMRCEITSVRVREFTRVHRRIVVRGFPPFYACFSGLSAGRCLTVSMRISLEVLTAQVASLRGLDGVESRALNGK